MYCIAHRRVLPNLPEKERQLLLTQAHLHTLVEMLEAITDPPRQTWLALRSPVFAHVSDHCSVVQLSEYGGREQV